MFCENCGKELSSQEKFCMNCGEKTFFAENSIAIRKEYSIVDSFSYEQTVSFLENVKTLEQHKYTLENIIKMLQEKAKSLQYREKISSDENPTIIGTFSFFIFLAKIPILIGAICFFLTSAEEIAVAMAVICLLIGAFCIFGHVGQKNDYREKLQKAENNFRFRMTKVAEINNEINKFSKELQSVEVILQRAYSLNVVHSKYCSLVPIATIYEYFEVGRCNSLKGEHGAYNIYESELRQNLIISKLDEVISRLDIIANTQYMLYEAIQESNRILSGIASQTDGLINTTKSMASNMEAIKYNSKLSADYTRVSAFIDVFEKVKD